MRTSSRLAAALVTSAICLFCVAATAVAQDDAAGLAKALRSRVPADRAAAFQTVKRGDTKEGDDKAAAVVCAALAREDDKAVLGAGVAALEKLRPDLRPHVSTLLIDSDSNAQYNAVSALKKLRADARPSLPVVIAHMEKVADPTRKKAVRRETELINNDVNFLQAVAPDSDETRRALVSLSTSPHPGFRRDAVTHMGLIAKTHSVVRPEFLRAIVASLQDPRNAPRKMDSDTVRFWAIAAIQNFGAEAKDAAPIVRQFLADPNESVRNQAARTLKVIGGE